MLREAYWRAWRRTGFDASTWRRLDGDGRSSAVELRKEIVKEVTFFRL